jgi:molybdopterin-biosynthesis enzyme MoeA-like protein
LEKYYKPDEFTEGRQKMSKMPISAKLILNPTSGAPGFNVENVFCLPGVPSILQSMIGGLNNILVGGDPIENITISLRTVESEIAKSITEIQNKNRDVEIGSYPFFRAGKLGVSIVLRSSNKNKLNKCNSEVLEFVKSKSIEIVEEV